jgi:hypothetical protein
MYHLMAEILISKSLRRLILAWLAVACLAASEHHGTVTANGLPVPGATVTAVQGDKKLITTTDDRGFYSFPELADGIWTIQVDMLGFSRLSQEVAVAADAPSPAWSLKLLTMDAIQQQLKPPASAPATATVEPATPPPNTAQASATGAPTASAPRTAATQAGPAQRNRQNGGGRGGQNTANGGRPSLRQALGQQGNGFQRLDVNEADGQSATADMAGATAGGDTTQSSDAFVVNGSV